jgi:hypothetical protein
MHNLKWHLFTIRTQIGIRLIQLGINHRLRARMTKVLANVTDIPRLTIFAERMEAKKKRLS